MSITKPPVLPAWGDGLSSSPDIVQPTNTQISAGWPLTTTPPSRGRFNWILNFLANAVRYFSRRGLPDYDSAETYMTGDIVRGDDGLYLYSSLIDNNINHAPSTSPTQWGSISTKTPAADDNTAKIATTAWALGQLSSSVPVMDGNGAIGVSLRFARADHVHPSDSSKANTSGSYPNLSVGVAANAAAVPFSGVSGKPTSCAGYGITDAITTANINVQSVAYANSAGRAYPYRYDGAPISIAWVGQAGQPNWLLGSNDGINYYVWNPANFSVNFATSAGSAANATTQSPGTSNASIATTAFVQSAANPGASIAENGYQKLPGGLIIQWGFAIGATAQFSTNFPIPFPNACFSVTSTTKRTDSSLTLGANVVDSLTTAGFVGTWHQINTGPNSGNWGGFWMAIGH